MVARSALDVDPSRAVADGGAGAVRVVRGNSCLPADHLEPDHEATSRDVGGMKRSPNKRMQLTKLRAAPVLQAEVPPCAPAGQMNGGTASQLIRSVGQTVGRRGEGTPWPHGGLRARRGRSSVLE